MNSSNITRPIDWWFNIIHSSYNLKYYWLEPPLLNQGSGIFFNQLLINSLKIHFF